MFETVESPKTGQPLRAAWATKMANRVNELCTAVSPGMLIRDGVGGFGAEPIPGTKRLPRVSSQTLPWTFKCTVGADEDGNETRTGGWYNGQIQIGFSFVGRQNGEVSSDFTGCSETSDGVYYLKLKLSSSEYEIVRFESSSGEPQNDYETETYYVYIGRVEDSKQTDGIYCVPVIYKYL